jgi:hypothetical protein
MSLTPSPPIWGWYEILQLGRLKMICYAITFQETLQAISNVLFTLVEAGTYITAVSLHPVQRAPTLTLIK